MSQRFRVRSFYYSPGLCIATCKVMQIKHEALLLKAVNHSTGLTAWQNSGKLILALSRHPQQQLCCLCYPVHAAASGTFRQPAQHLLLAQGSCHLARVQGVGI